MSLFAAAACGPRPDPGGAAQSAGPEQLRRTSADRGAGKRTNGSRVNRHERAGNNLSAVASRRATPLWILCHTGRRGLIASRHTPLSQGCGGTEFKAVQSRQQASPPHSKLLPGSFVPFNLLPFVGALSSARSALRPTNCLGLAPGAARARVGARSAGGPLGNNDQACRPP